METLVSIIVPCYKYAHYLPDCIGSIRNQSYKNIEIIVVDDLSPDNTKEVCKELGVMCISHTVNKGLGASRNTGIAAAKGKYIMCLDADDMLTPDSIEEHVSLMKKNVIAQCGLSEFGVSNQKFRPEGATEDSLFRRNTVYCNAMFEKTMWQKVAGYDEGDIMRLGLEDWEFWIRCAKAGAKFKTSPYIGLLYRKHSNNMTKDPTHPNWTKIPKYMMRKIKILRKM